MHLSARTGMSQVEINACWREALKKENRGRIMKEDFDFNPKNLIAITEKPTTVRNVPEAEMEATKKDLAILQEKLAETAKVPKKKFSYAMTSSQEVGWDMDTHHAVHKP